MTSLPTTERGKRSRGLRLGSARRVWLENEEVRGVWSESVQEAVQTKKQSETLYVRVSGIWCVGVFTIHQKTLDESWSCYGQIYFVNLRQNVESMITSHNHYGSLVWTDGTLWVIMMLYLISSKRLY
jgi:hypothetical protein